MGFIIGNLSILLCMLFGVGFVIAELLLPGFGLPGVSGIVLLTIALVQTGLRYGMLTAVAVLLVLAAVLAALAVLIFGRAARCKNSRLFLQDKEELRTQEDMKVLVGKRGIANSALRPAGIGEFDGVRLGVVTEGDFIEKGSSIEIVSADGAKIVVRAL